MPDQEGRKIRPFSGTASANSQDYIRDAARAHRFQVSRKQPVGPAKTIRWLNDAGNHGVLLLIRGGKEIAQRAKALHQLVEAVWSEPLKLDSQ
jgi:hypothetical protein